MKDSDAAVDDLQLSKNGRFTKLPINAAYLGKPAHLRTRKDRYDFGRSLREHCAREDHAEFKTNARDRVDSVDLLIASNQGRVKELLPIRYGRMIASPFACFRGAAMVMASDLARGPATGYALQACGDSHLMNFGAFATPERNVIFDINDFDETFPAPWEWDLKRLAASMVIASRHNKYKADDCRTAAFEVVQAYRDKMRQLAEMPVLQAWYSYLDYEELIELGTDEKLKKKRKKVLSRALERTHQEEFVRIAHMQDGKPRIRDNPPLVYHAEEQQGVEYEERVRYALAE